MLSLDDPDAGAGSGVAADLDQVLVRVAEVDAADGAGGAGALDRAFLDGDIGRRAFGSNSCPARCRLTWLRPKARAVRPGPNVTASMPSTRVQNSAVASMSATVSTRWSRR
jgi:hypothetical protein